MNILELCVAPGLGGLELYFHRCCVELQRKGHTVISVRLTGSRLEALGKKDGIPTRSMSRGNKFFPWRHARQLGRIIAEHRIDIVHAHHKDDLPLAALTKSTSQRPFKLVFTRQMPMKHKKKDPYHRWLYTKIDLFLTITELLKRDALEKLPMPADRVQRLYYGVSAPPPKDEEFLKQFLTISQPGDFTIGVFSRLEFQKGQHLVIKALKKLIDQKIPARLYVVGDSMSPEYHASLLSMVKTLQLEERVAFKGFISEPVFAMMGMDVMILPSRNEAFGLVLIEAMRCGIAVAGVNAGGVPEIITHGETGLLFEWDNPDQLAEQLAELFRDPGLRNKLAINGKAMADMEFNSDSHFGQLENLFSELISR